MNVLEHNRMAWDRYAARKNPWTVPVTSEQIAAARSGQWRILLTPTRPVPRSWFPPLAGTRLLCLASGGGQQGPVLAAAGAEVTVLDNSPRQLQSDRDVAEREGLSLETVLGDMADLSVFPDASFDVVVHPVSNCFVPDVHPVWREACRVLRDGGLLLAGFTNPVLFLFVEDLQPDEPLIATQRIPHSDIESLPEATKRRFVRDGEAFEFGHTLEDQLGGQLQAGFVITALYEDRFPEDRVSALIPTFMATRAAKEPIKST